MQENIFLANGMSKWRNGVIFYKIIAYGYNIKLGDKVEIVLSD